MTVSLVISFIQLLLMLVVLIASILVISFIAVYFIQNGMVYVPYSPSKAFRYPESNPAGFRHPGEKGMDYREVTVTTRDGLRLKGWFVRQKVPRGCDTIIYFHENAGNIGNRLQFISDFYFQLGVNVLIVGYRGYGHSEGHPSEKGLE